MWWTRPQYLADKVPWRHYAGSSVMENEDHSLSRYFRMRGPDLTGLSSAEIGSFAQRLNLAFKAIPGHWSVDFEHLRLLVKHYADAVCTHPVLRTFDAHRRTTIIDTPTYENTYYLVLRRQPIVRGLSWLTDGLMTRPQTTDATSAFETHVRRFIGQTDHIAVLLRSVLADCLPLTPDALAQYLYAVANGRSVPVRMPRDGTHLNWRLCTSRFQGGWEPTLGQQHLAFASITMYPDTSISAMWEALDHLDLECRRVVRWIAHQRQVSRGMFRRIETRHKTDQTSILQELGRQFGKTPEVTDTYEGILADDTSKARQEVSGNYVVYGHFSPWVMTWGTTRQEANARIALVAGTLEDVGFSVIIEGEGTKDAFLGMQPGDIRHGRRRHLLSSLNVAHLSPGMSASWEGPARDEHLKAPAWFLAHTAGSTLIRVVNHVRDVGHVAVLGPTGAGKSGKISLTAASWLAQYHTLLRARVLQMDIGRSSRALNLCLGGRYDDLEARQPLYQPLRFIDEPDYFGWAYEWLMDALETYKVEGLARIRAYVREGLEILARMPKDQRTLEQLQRQLERQSKISQRGLSTLGAGSEVARARQQAETNAVMNAQWDVRQAIEDMDKARLLSGTTDEWTESMIHTIELGSLLRQRRLASVLLPYLAKRARMSFGGVATLYQVDEDALVLSLPKGEEEQMDDLRSLRKANASLMVATHSLVDVMASAVGSLIIESCPTMILLANPAAQDPKIAQVYEDLGCSEAEIRDISEMRAQGEYYLRTTYRNQSRRRKYSIDMTGVTLALCGSSSDEDHEIMDKLLERHAPGVEFAKAFFYEKGIDHATIMAMQ